MSVPEEPEVLEEGPEEDEVEVEEDLVPVPMINFKWNNNSEKSYRKYKFPVPETLHRYENQFLESVDLRNGEIQRKVYKIIRCRATDYKDMKTKEYLYYMEKWSAFDYLGNELNVHEHLEGRYDEAQIRYVVDTKTGKPKKSEAKLRGTRPVFYIPFNKQTVDKILKDVEKESIEYVVKFGDATKGEARRDNSFSYEQFVNCDYAALVKLSYQAGGPRATPYIASTNTKK